MRTLYFAPVVTFFFFFFFFLVFPRLISAVADCTVYVYTSMPMSLSIVDLYSA